MTFTFPWQSVTQFVTSRHSLARTRGPALHPTFIEFAMSSKRQKTLHSFFYEKVNQRKLACGIRIVLHTTQSQVAQC